MAERYGHVTNALVCEDIRQEISSKNTLVGVYAGDVVVKEFPATIRVAVYAEYVIDRPAEHEVRVRMSYQGAERHSIVDVGMKVPGSTRGGVAFALPPTALLISEVGNLIVEVNVVGDPEWLAIVSKTVRTGAATPLGARPAN